MKLFLYLILLLLAPIYNYAQDHAEEIHAMKGNPKKVTYIFKPPLHHDGRWKHIYLLNDSGKIKQQLNFLKNKQTAEYHYKYDKYGRLISETHYNRINHVDTAEIITYDYLLDKNNSVITEKRISQNNVWWIKDSISYNQYGLTLAYKKRWPGSHNADEPEISTFRYMDKKPVYSKIIPNTNTIDERNFEYNDNGNISRVQVHQEMIGSNKDIKENIKTDRTTQYKYQYDKHGNWVKRYTSIDNSKLELDIVRRIVYR